MQVLEGPSGSPARVRAKPSWLDMLSLQEHVTLIHCSKKLLTRVLRPLRHGPHTPPRRLVLCCNPLILQYFTARPETVLSKEGPTPAVTPAKNPNRRISPCLSRRYYGGIFGGKVPPPPARHSASARHLAGGSSCLLGFSHGRGYAIYVPGTVVGI